MKTKLLVLTILFLIVIPTVLAEHEEEEEEKPSIFDLNWSDIGKKIAESFHDFIFNIINEPLQPLLNSIKAMLNDNVNIDVFKDIWRIITYVLSSLFGLLFMYSGFNFITSGDDPAKREKAKTWLKNIIIMIVLINASFYIYSIILQFNSLLTQGVLSLIDENFFVMQGYAGLGEKIVLYTVYLITLLATMIILSIRYIIVAFGVAFFPIGIFLYFIEPAKRYGKLILNFLIVSISLTFVDSIIILVSSQLVNTAAFSNFHMLLMTSAFGFCNLIMLYLMFFAAVKSGVSTTAKVVAMKSNPAMALASSALESNNQGSQNTIQKPPIIKI